MAPVKNSKSLQSLCFSIAVVFFFFGIIEALLRFAGFEPELHFKSFTIPSWVEEMDPVVLKKYQQFVDGQGFVNEDIYAYKPDFRYGYLLKSGVTTTVQNYSSAFVVNKLPPWTIIADSEGFRASTQSKGITEVNGKTLYVLGDFSSFGWGVNYEKSYAYLLNEKLNTVSDFNLSNFSLPGFSSFQGKLLWQEIEGVKKDDWVILSYGWNDSYPSLRTDQRQFELRNSLAGKIIWKLKKLLLYRWITTWGLPGFTPKDKGGTRVPLEQYRENLESLIEGVKLQGARPLFVNVCNPETYQDSAEQIAKNKKIPHVNFPSALKPYLSTVHDRFPELFVTYFEAYGEFMEDDPMLAFLFPDRCHPNEIGHGLMAEIIFQAIKKDIKDMSENNKSNSNSVKKIRTSLKNYLSKPDTRTSRL